MIVCRTQYEIQELWTEKQLSTENIPLFAFHPTKAQESFPIDNDLHHFHTHRRRCATPKIRSTG